MRRSDKIKACLLVLVLLLCMFQISILGRDVAEKLTTLSTAKNDNLQWNISQVEVEFLQLIVAVDQAKHEGVSERLENVRRRFDVFYSRISTLKESRLFVDLRGVAVFQMHLAQIDVFLSESAAFIDGRDDALVDYLPQLAHDANDLQADVRRLALGGINFFARSADQQRNAISQTLGQLGLATLALVVALIVVLLSLTRLYRASQKASTENEITRARQEAMVTSSLDAILMTDTAGRILEYNGAAEAVFGYQRDEAIGHNMADLIVPEHLREAHTKGMARYLETGQPKVIGQGQVQLEALRKSGEIFPVELSISVTKNQSKEVFVSFLRDISERLEAETQLRQARDEARAGETAKANLLTVMSHEMRTPLNGVLGTLELFKKTNPSPEQIRYLDAIRISGDVLLRHVNDVLELSRLDAQAIPIASKAISLIDFMEAVIEGQKANAQMRGNQLELSLSQNIPDYVLGDEHRIQQCLLNLLGNAIKFTSNGHISVEVEPLNSGQEIEFRVIDDGAGIAEDALDRIFDEFVTLDASYSRQSEGTGLGLAITRRLIASMGGEIGAESEPNEGSLFWFRLPLRAISGDTNLSGASPRLDLPEDISVLKILIVEDNEINRLVLRELLQNAGHVVFEAEDGEAGVRAATEDEFDVILMDISMPGMDGIQATQVIRNMNGPSSDVPIVAVTAHAALDDHQHISEAGFNDIITKPISESELLNCLTKLFSEDAPLDNTETTGAPLIECVGYLGVDKCREFLLEFKKEVENLCGTLSSAKRLSEKVRGEAHRLAGSAAVFGFSHLRKQLLAVETVNADIWQRDNSELLMELALTWGQSSEEIDRFFAEHPVESNSP
ncbi:PAS domain-containing hybrid sensor histidine kinase/response regulator [Cochlodiniinecator piscidefendens]|uniref:PAS domain-containing hybrid sensor histidine kinase/response regulator n=1 Tax=Cochlodiniinecator piscidefendens TaxID=2715756 RepID=UPI00140B7F06|nr:PAS domain-containing hybrid sensor histidine kinase/response regulator [Cochlodiniinecator piscidefendens]